MRTSGRRRMHRSRRLLLRAARVLCRHSSACGGDRQCRRHRRDTASGCDRHRARPSPQPPRPSSKTAFVILIEVRPLARRASAIMFEVGVHGRTSSVCAYSSAWNEPARLSQAFAPRPCAFARGGLQRLRGIFAGRRHGGGERDRRAGAQERSRESERRGCGGRGPRPRRALARVHAFRRRRRPHRASEQQGAAGVL